MAWSPVGDAFSHRCSVNDSCKRESLLEHRGLATFSSRSDKSSIANSENRGATHFSVIGEKHPRLKRVPGIETEPVTEVKPIASANEEAASLR